MRRRLERNPKAGTFVKPAGYEDIGGQLHPGHPSWDRVQACRDAGHPRREFDNSTFRFRCTDVITICDECKYIYHTDMSD
jgi:hypothetical protein